jgi:hypothetical protein
VDKTSGRQARDVARAKRSRAIEASTKALRDRVHVSKRSPGWRDQPTIRAMRRSIAALPVAEATIRRRPPGRLRRVPARRGEGSEAKQAARERELHPGPPRPKRRTTARARAAVRGPPVPRHGRRRGPPRAR